MWIEIFGTISSVIIAISLMQKNIKWLRIINTIGALSLSIYGGIIQSFPVVSLNVFIVFINLYYIRKLYNQKEYFDFLVKKEAGAVFLQKFLDFYLKDIQKFMPHFTLDQVQDCDGCFILRDTKPIALILYRDVDKGVREMILDYSIPSYRDYRNTRYFLNFVIQHLNFVDTKKIVAKGDTAIHKRYLEKMGFKAGDNQSNEFELSLENLSK